MHRLALTLLFCSAPFTLQAQTATTDDEALRRLESIDASLQAVMRVLERQVAQTDAVLAMQQVSLQTVLALRLGDEVDSLAQVVKSTSMYLAYQSSEIEDLEDAERSHPVGEDEGNRELRRRRLKDLREEVESGKADLQESELRLSEKRSEHARCVDELRAWQERLDDYLSRHEG